MPSARDLLQQADALMRSNRNVGVSGGEETVPLLTDVAVPGRNIQPGQPHGEDIPVLTNVVSRKEQGFGAPVPRDRAADRRFSPTQMDSILPLSEMPQMPPVGDDDSIIAMRRSDSRIDLPVEPEDTAEDKPRWLEADLLDIPVPPSASRDANGPGHPDRHDAQSTTVPLPRHDELSAERLNFIPDAVPAPAPTPEALAESTSHATAETETLPTSEAATPVIASQRVPTAEEVAETVYFQVLQNLDLYTERALQQHMTEHLAPIVEKASQELLATLNANLGALMRQYVAEAIEKQVGVRPSPESALRDR